MPTPTASLAVSAIAVLPLLPLPTKTTSHMNPAISFSEHQLTLSWMEEADLKASPDRKEGRQDGIVGQSDRLCR